MKFYGAIGFGIPVEGTAFREGIWDDEAEEHPYYGDVIHSSQRWTDSPDGVNDDLRINEKISIVADQFAFRHSSTIKYVAYLGAKWKVSNIEVKAPRLILTLGGVYNGPSPSTS